MKLTTFQKQVIEKMRNGAAIHINKKLYLSDIYEIKELKISHLDKFGEMKLVEYNEKKTAFILTELGKTIEL